MNLEPSGEMLLTIRGALPLFVYRQYDAAFAGYSFTWHTQHNDWRFGIRSEASFGRNLESGKPVPLQAPPDIRLILQRRIGNVQFSFEPSHVFRAPFADQLEDFLPPPRAYTLLRANMSWKTRLPGGHDLELLAGGDNLFNTAYRDYLNRFRYYADESGRNLYISLRIALHRHDHDHHIKP
jgi:iron complex outermembrane receptor protein